MSIIIMLLLNYFIFYVVAILVPNYYLAMMIASLIIAFLYPFISYKMYKRKILSIDFLANFLINAIMLLFIDLLFFVILR